LSHVESAIAPLPGCDSPNEEFGRAELVTSPAARVAVLENTTIGGRPLVCADPEEKG
jgi:hypothetical protein